MPHAAFVPLRVFSAYTMLEGAIDPKIVVKQAKKLGFPAVAVTDRNGLYGAMAFTDAAIKDGIQPIIATMLGVARPETPAGKPAILDWLSLYAQDEAGYNNLCALVSAAHLGRPIEEDAHVTLDALEGRTDGLIALTAGGEGALARLLADQQQGSADAYCDRLETLFPGRLYIELARRNDATETAAEPALIDLAYARDLPLVATNPAFFAEADFHAAHDAMLCIAHSAYVDSDDRVRSSRDTWLKPAAEMERLFADVPEAIANTLVVAQRCAFGAPTRKPILPSIAGDREGEATALRRDSLAGLLARLRVIDLGSPSPLVPRDVDARDASDAQRVSASPDMEGAETWKERYPAYFARLDFELDIITQMGFSGYFLIVADFIKWAKDQDIPVGPGRGSGAGSVVSWALTITNLDPLQFGLLFERMLNPERVSMPDFDIDFCETRRGEVIQYVQQKYGADKVAQIITFGRLKARAVLKDTGRVLQMSYGQVDRLAKAVPNHPTDPWTLERALNGVPELENEVNSDKAVKRLFDLAKKLEGLPRHSSTHAAGVVIGDRPLDQLVPLYRDPRSDMPVTQFDVKYIEAAGPVKFDFLGLKTLSVLKKAVGFLKDKGVEVDLDTLALGDADTYALIARADTVGVFQFESEGMRRMLTAVRPSCFDDIIALGALYRPGPMDNIPAFAARKNGREEIVYPHPLLEPILKETYGIFVYQEQVMKAGQVLAGYSLGGADLLRRAMGKKIKAEMDLQRATFIEGSAKTNAISTAKANELFDLIDKFAGYGFNKSHAAAYALISYQTAWLKAHHPAEFFAASMCYDMGQTDKLCILIDDMRRLDVNCLGPCLNRSEAEFSVEGDSVRYALGALKGVGEGAMEQLVRERRQNGAFKSVDDFAHRIDPRLLNRRQLESLAGGGALDALEPNRAALHAGAEIILGHAAAAHRDRTSDQTSLFGGGASSPEPVRLPAVQTWSMADQMAAEKDAFGFYFSAHPLDRYRHILSAHAARGFADLCSQPASAEGARTGAVMAALVEETRYRTSARGRRYLMVTCSDNSGQFIATCFDDDAAADLEAAAKAGGCALLHVELDRKAGEETPRITVRRIQPLEALSSNTRLRMTVTASDPAILPALAALTTQRDGRGELVLHATLPDGRTADVLLARDAILDAELAARIERLPGVSVTLEAVTPPRLALVG